MESITPLYIMTAILTIITSFIASTGFWAWLQKRGGKRSATSRLLMGLSYDKITTQGMRYIERGWISKDEFQDFQKYLFEPYKEFGGNGVAERIMVEVSHLPLKTHTMYMKIERAKALQKESYDDGNWKGPIDG